MDRMYSFEVTSVADDHTGDVATEIAYARATSSQHALNMIRNRYEAGGYVVVHSTPSDAAATDRTS